MSPDRVGPTGAKRYTIEFGLPRGESSRICAITPAGEAMAIALATARLLMLNPDAPFIQARVVLIEDEYVADLAEDVIDYWNTA
jgi:hypothetical protein